MSTYLQRRFGALDLPPGQMQDEAIRILRVAKETYRPARTFALVSGGHDSTAMLCVARPFIDAAVHINTGIGVPEATGFVRSLCQSLSVELIELVTSPSIYQDIVLGPTKKGFPGPAHHYITYHRLKAERLQELQRDYSQRGQVILFVTGVRENESQRRMLSIGATEHNGPRRRLGRCAWANPILHWTSWEMIALRDEYGIPRSPVADRLHRSGECLCGAFARPNELEEIAFWYPETAAYIRSLEAEARRLGKRYSVWGPGGRGVPSPGPLCSDCQLTLTSDAEAEEDKP